MEEFNMDGWEVFGGYRHRGREKALRDQPWITITQGGRQINLNKKAIELLGNPSWVTLAYSRSQQIIRIDANDERKKRSHIPVHQISTISTIPSKAFTATYDIDTSQARRYVAEWKDGALYIDLKQSALNVTRRRA